MAVMEHGVATQRVVVLFLLLLCLVILPNKRLGGPGNTKVRGFCQCANILNIQ